MRISDWSSDVCSSDLSTPGSRRARHCASSACPIFPWRPPGCRKHPIAPPSHRGSSHRRSEEHTSELQSLMRISYAVFCLKKKNTKNHTKTYKKNIKRQQHEHGRHTREHRKTTQQTIESEYKHT